jgi:hypothetical protein
MKFEVNDRDRGTLWLDPSRLSIDVSDLERRLQQARPGYGYAVIPLVCGQCPQRRRLDRLRIHEAPGPPMIVGELAHDRNAGLVRDTRPSIRVTLGGAPESNKIRYYCHPRRCKFERAVRPERLVEAFLRAFEEGRTEIVLGVDV